jgi:hypothetical protein
MTDSEVCVLTIDAPPAEGNFRDESGNPVKPLIIADCGTHAGYMDKGDQIATSYGICTSCVWSLSLL